MENKKQNVLDAVNDTAQALKMLIDTELGCNAVVDIQIKNVPELLKFEVEIRHKEWAGILSRTIYSQDLEHAEATIEQSLNLTGRRDEYLISIGLVK